jgi:hypothetical protein
MRVSRKCPATLSIAIQFGTYSKTSDVVIQTLGVDISSRAIFERTTLFSRSTRIVVDAMKAAGVKQLIAVTGLGAGDSRGHGGFLYDTLAFPLLLKRLS